MSNFASVMSQSTPAHAVKAMTIEQEVQLADRLRGEDSPTARMLRRKLLLRQRKRDFGLPLFDLDAIAAEYVRWARLFTHADGENGKALVLPKSALHPDKVFRHLVYGHRNNDGRHVSYPTESPFSARLLKPFIFRDDSVQPPHRKLMAELARKLDYVYFRDKHLAQVNHLLVRQFWPGIDVSESLQYPEYGVVALSGELVVGCALMTPEGYINYVAVLPGWQHVGIARFMIVWLCQILYQYLGFKPEQFIVGFYESYYPAESSACRHAFFLRLRQ
ncbi:hypothetical protein RI367_005970 [Sorochytrium milnesiophthora]